MNDEQPIKVQCQSCGFNLRVRQKGAGKTVKCPGCSSQVRVPLPPPTPPEPIFKNDVPESELNWLDEAQLEGSFESGSPGAFERINPQVPRMEDTPPAAFPSSPNVNPFSPIRAVSVSESAIKLPSVRSYPVLVIAAKICRVLGYIILTIATVLILISFAVTAGASLRNGENAPAAFLAWVLTSLWMGVVAIFGAAALIMNAELIELSMHIQSNTLATAHAVRSLRR